MHPETVLGYQMLYIAFIGLSVNIISIAILHGSHRDNMNIRGVFYHMISDAVSSIGIILAAVIILITGWSIIDPLVSLLISGLILYWAWGILKESSRILLETAPKGLDIDIIRDDLKKNFSEIKNLNNMHLWTIIPEMIVFSAHISLKEDQDNIDKEKLIADINRYLEKKYNIIESTIQISLDEELLKCN
jgi:cobalt-zinc-cadmium efflux system protein